MAHIEMAKAKRNFQSCPVCTTCNALIRRAARLGDTEAHAQARAEKRSHLLQQRAERRVSKKGRACVWGRLLFYSIVYHYKKLIMLVMHRVCSE